MRRVLRLRQRVGVDERESFGRNETSLVSSGVCVCGGGRGYLRLNPSNNQ